EKLSGRSYGSTLPASGSTGDTEQEKTDVAFRVIADHIRTLSFAIADGIQPGNTDRNYVLRRILRRAVRYGRSLGLHEPFFHKLVDVLARTMGDVFPEIRAKQKHIEQVLKLEEETFNRTLDKGITLFNEEAAKGDITAPFAFKLYDEQGFPLDLTELMARERGLKVDTAGFETLMEAQRARARAAQKKEVITLSEIETTAPTHFTGYESLTEKARVLEVVSIKNKTAVILDTTPCYAEMGGQIGDTAEITGSGQLWHVTNTQKTGHTYLHLLDSADAPAVGSEVEISVTGPRRAAIQRHHTVTHLLHWALHEVVSKDATQKGSSVSPEKLSFDFNSAPLTPQQVRDIENLVNERILANAPVSWTEVPYTEVRGRADIMQFFGDKYGDTVRVVQIGGSPAKLDGYSMELCAGTHTRATGEIGLFRILSEAAIAAGVRRIEAVAGLEACALATSETQRLQEIARLLNSPAAEIEKKLEALLIHQKELEKTLKAARAGEAAASAKDLASKAETLNGIPFLAAHLGAVDGDYLQAVLDALKPSFDGAAILAGSANNAVALAASVSPAHVSKIQAGKLIQTAAPIVGGKGGGKPDSARGGGKDTSKIPEALAAAQALVRSV
ncbi:MAG: alanine--tRNA ligase, partial [Verrucomicrobiota bacterium]